MVMAKFLRQLHFLMTPIVIVSVIFWIEWRPTITDAYLLLFLNFGRFEIYNSKISKIRGGINNPNTFFFQISLIRPRVPLPPPPGGSLLLRENLSLYPPFSSRVAVEVRNFFQKSWRAQKKFLRWLNKQLDVKPLATSTGSTSQQKCFCKKK